MNESIGKREELFTQALALPEAERMAFLRERCGDDAALLRDLAELISAAEGAHTFLDRPCIQPPRSDRDAAGPSSTVPVWIDHYRVVETLGEGGCGVVYRAEQVLPIRRSVALKILRSGMDSREVVSRFESERQLLASMDHPNVARVFDAGTTSTGRPYFVMELIRGEPITRYCDVRRLSLRERLALFVQVCRAVQHAHDRGIVHRDIKPSNILVAEFDGVPLPKVIDFGVAKALQPTIDAVRTARMEVIGTPGYMSPEQLRLGPDQIDARTDVHGLGILLHELLVGVLPWDLDGLGADGIDGLCRRICDEPVLPPSAMLSGMFSASRQARAAERAITADDLTTTLRGGLDAIVLRCLEKNRDDRYPEASGVARDVLHIMETHAFQAGSPGGQVERVVSPGTGGDHPSPVRGYMRRASREVGASLVVLPFTNHGQDPEDDLFAAGIHEDVITHLARIRSLRIISRAASVAYAALHGDLRAMGTELEVGHVVEGSVRRQGARVRVNLHLTDVRTLSIVWAESFEGRVPTCSRSRGLLPARSRVRCA